MSNTPENKAAMRQLLKAGIGIVCRTDSFYGFVYTPKKDLPAYIIEHGRNLTESFAFVPGNEPYQDIAIEAVVDRFFDLAFPATVIEIPASSPLITIPPVTDKTRVFPYE
jgi:hypothetical protein